MIVVDVALERCEREGRPVRVELVGAGYMGRGIALQLLTPLAGLRLVAIANRTLSEARRAFRDAGVAAAPAVRSCGELDDAIARRQHAVTDDAAVLCDAAGIDVVIECTGEVEFGATVVLRAIEHGKHVVLVNAELDATVGPILKVYADRRGVVFTNTDGDEPGVAMNLFRFVQTIGYRPVLVGNLKGLLDPHRTPETQARHVRPSVRPCEGRPAALSAGAAARRRPGGLPARCRAAHGCVRPRLRRPPDQAAVHELLQDGNRAPVRVLHALPPAAPAGSDHRGARRALSRRHGGTPGRARVRGADRRQTGSSPGRGARWHRRLHLLWHHRQRRRRVARAAPADGAGGRLLPHPRRAV